LFDTFSRVVGRWWTCGFWGRGNARELTEVGIKNVDNGKKGRRERERMYVSMIDRCQAIVKTA